MSGTTMPAVIWAGPDHLELQDVPVPALPAGSALIEAEYIGICG